MSPYQQSANGHFPFGDSGTSGASGSAILIVSSRTTRKSSPLFELKAPTTFSHTINRGRINLPVRPRPASASLISFMILICSINRPLRFPAKPARFPATDRSWLTRRTSNDHIHGGQPVPVQRCDVSKMFHLNHLLVLLQWVQGEPPISSFMPRPPYSEPSSNWLGQQRAVASTRL